MMLGPSQVRSGYVKFLEMTNQDFWAVFLGAGKPRRAFLTMPRPQPGEKKRQTHLDQHSSGFGLFFLECNGEQGGPNSAGSPEISSPDLPKFIS